MAVRSVFTPSLAHARTARAHFDELDSPLHLSVNRSEMTTLRKVAVGMAFCAVLLVASPPNIRAKTITAAKAGATAAHAMKNGGSRLIAPLVRELEASRFKVRRQVE